MVIIPLILNGAIGAHLHVNFAVASRASFGFYLSRAAVVIRMITALFWHGTSISQRFSHPQPPPMLTGLSSHPNIHRFDGDDAGHSCDMAFVPRYPKHNPGISRHHYTSDVLSRSVLEPPVPFPSDSAPQAQLVLRDEDGRRYGHFSRRSHCTLCQGWWRRRDLAAAGSRVRVNEKLADLVVYVEHHGLMVCLIPMTGASPH